MKFGTLVDLTENFEKLIVCGVMITLKTTIFIHNTSMNMFKFSLNSYFLCHVII